MTVASAYPFPPASASFASLTAPARFGQALFSAVIGSFPACRPAKVSWSSYFAPATSALLCRSDWPDRRPNPGWQQSAASTPPVPSSLVPYDLLKKLRFGGCAAKKRPRTNCLVRGPWFSTDAPGNPFLVDAD